MPLKRRLIEIGIGIACLAAALIIAESSFGLGFIIGVGGLMLLWRQLEMSRRATPSAKGQQQPRGSRQQQPQTSRRRSIGGFISEEQMSRRQAEWKAEYERRARRNAQVWEDPLRWIGTQVLERVNNAFQNEVQKHAPPAMRPPPRPTNGKTASASSPRPKTQDVPKPPPKVALPPDPEMVLPGGDTAYTHAIDAARAAGLDLHASVLPVDVGVMVFKEGERLIYRTHSPEDDAEYLQPFIVLKLRTRAVGRIRFEMIDGDGQRLFVFEDHQELESGHNLISPAARLRMLDSHNFQGQWKLDVSADHVPLAHYTFGWAESRTTILRRQLNQDGELPDAARARLMDEDPFNRITLDDLLADQADGEIKPQKQTRR